MNDLKITTKYIPITPSDELPVKDCLLLSLFIDGKNMLEDQFFEDSFLIWEQLKATKSKSGDFFLFCGITGILEEFGWELASKVEHKHNCVEWTIIRLDKEMRFAFDRSKYQAIIDSLDKEISVSNKKVEPHMIYELSLG